MQPAELSIAAVTFSEVPANAAHHDHLSLSFPVLADPDRAIYRRFNLGRGSIRRVYGPATLLMYARAMAKGTMPKRPVADTLQLGGDFVIGQDGRLSATFRPDSPDTRPTPAELFQAIQSGIDT